MPALKDIAAFLAVALLLTMAAACQGQPPAMSTTTPTQTRLNTPTTVQWTATPIPSPHRTATPLAVRAQPTDTAVPKRTTPSPATEQAPTPAQPTARPKATEPPVTDEMTDEPGPPGDPETVMALIASLTQETQDCLPEEIREGRFTPSILELMSARHAQVLTEAANCLSDEEITRLMILPGLAPAGPLPDEQANCIVAGNTGELVRATLPLLNNFAALDAALFAVAAHLTLTATSCVPPENHKDLFLAGTELDRLRCITPTAADAAHLRDRIITEGPQALDNAIQQAQPCLLLYPPAPLIEPLPNCTEEQKESGLPCRLD